VGLAWILELLRPSLGRGVWDIRTRPPVIQRPNGALASPSGSIRRSSSLPTGRPPGRGPVDGCALAYLQTGSPDRSRAVAFGRPVAQLVPVALVV